MNISSSLLSHKTDSVPFSSIYILYSNQIILSLQFYSLSPSRGDQKKTIKKCVFFHVYISATFKALHLMQYIYQDFSALLKVFKLNQFLCLLKGASDIFCFTSSTSAKSFPLRTFFQPGKQKVTLAVNRVGGAGGHTIFGQKLVNIQLLVGRCARKSPIMKWANTLNNYSKKFH